MQHTPDTTSPDSAAAIGQLPTSDVAYVPIPGDQSLNADVVYSLKTKLKQLLAVFYTAEGPDRIPLKARLIISTLLSALGALFFLEGTEDAAWYERSNSIIANFFLSLYATNSSMDYFSNRENSVKKVVALSAFSAFAYSPQVVISLYGSKDPTPLRAFIAVATLLSGIGSYAFSIVELVHLAQSMRRTIGQLEGTKTVLNNLDNAVERLIFANFDETTSFNAPEDWFALAQNMPEKWTPSDRLLSILNGTKKLLQATAALWLLLGDTGYMCDTANDLNRFFDLPASAAAGISAIMMICELMFNVIAGLYLGELLVNAPLNLLRYQKLPNTLKMGGSFAQYFCYFAPVIAGILSYGSSYTAVSVLDTCPNTQFNALLFPNMQEIVRQSTEAGNGIFTMMAILDLVKRYVKSTGKPAAKLLTAIEKLSALREEAAITSSHDAVTTLLKEEDINDEAIRQLSNNGFFSNNRLLPPASDETTRLVLTTSAP